MNAKTNLGERIARLRKERKLSQREVARRLRIASSTYREWEIHGRISAENITSLSEILRTTPAALLGYEEQTADEIKKAVYYIEEALELIKRSQK